MSSPIPIVLCGATETIGRGVIAGLQPEFEGKSFVIRFVRTTEQVVHEFPYLLSEPIQAPPPTDAESNIGTQNYTRSPFCVVVGAAYDEGMIQRMRESVLGKGKRDLPWLRPDLAIPMPPLGPEYGKKMVERVKKVLTTLTEEEGGGGHKGDEVVWY